MFPCRSRHDCTKEGIAMWLCFLCFNCGLWFRVGGLITRSGEWIAFLVCTTCGTYHEVHTRGWRKTHHWPASSTARTIFKAQDGPHLVPLPVERPFPRHANGNWSYYVEIEKPLKIRSNGDAASLACFNCGEMGTLTMRWARDNHHCPHCFEETLQNTSAART
jgi:hypothetical protein